IMIKGLYVMTKYLNAKEYDILDTILHSEDPVSVAEIMRSHPDFTSNIVQPAVRKMLKLGLIEVAEISVDGNIFSRRFKPAPTASNTIQKMFVDDYLQFSRLVSGQSLLSAMMQADDNPEKAMQEIAEMEKLLQEYKEKNYHPKRK
ncbi:MAG: MarR family transcriptional regulator, partial [Lachnospiraceae bacterium]|nr:MarR family transcriptional regulator [Lachnospiraceae bacterium]